MFTFFINIIGFIAINILLAYVLKERIMTILPITISALTLILFGLCLIRHLSWIDYFFVLTTVVVVLMGYFFRRKIDWIKLKAVVLDPNNIIIVGILLFVYVITWNRVVADYDELGVWAIEVKTMYYVDGLSLPNMHTSFEYANYLPGQMLIEWWFCHLSPSQFNEGLIFFGYFSIYYFIVTPLLVCRNSQSKWGVDLIRGLVMIPILFVIPSAFCVHEYSMLSVELPISAVFSALMYSLFDTKLYTKAYAGIKWIVLSMLLVLLKSDAVIFLVLVYFTAFILMYIDRKKAACEQNVHDEIMLRVREHLNYRILVLGLSLSAVTRLIWEMAVRYYHRSGGFTELRVLYGVKAVLETIIGKVELAEDKIRYIRSFRETILHQPLHLDTTFFIDLTVISCVILIMLVLYLIYRNQGFKNGKWEYLTVNCIAFGSIVLFLLMLLFMYAYIFCEDQYFDPTRMIKSVSRYAEPLLLGWSLTGLLICMNNKKTKLGIIVLVLFLMCPSYTRVIKYFNDLESATASASKVYSQEHKEFNEFFREDEEVFGAAGQGRILFVYGGDNESTINIRLFRYLAAPRSVYWLDYDDTDNFQEILYNKAIENFCGFIYFEQVPEEVVQTFVNEYNLESRGDYLYEIL